MRANKYTRLKLEPVIVGFLYYLLENGEANSIHETIEILIEAYMENYAKEKKIDLVELKKECIRLYVKTRKPQSKVSAERQKEAARKALEKIKAQKETQIIDESNIKAGTLKGGF